MRGLWSGAWTLALVPLALVAAIAAAIAFHHRSWLLAASLAAALVFSVWRLVGASRAHAHDRDHEDAAAAVFDGQELGSGVGVAQLAASLVLGAAITAAAVLLLWHAPGNAWGWALLAVGLVFGLGLAWRMTQGPATLLRVTRRGVWDARFGWVLWGDVERVTVEVAVVEGVRYGRLLLRVSPVQQEIVRRLDDAPRRGVPIARSVAAGRALEYNLQFLALHPDEVRAVAEGWWTVHHRGYRPEPAGIHEEVARRARTAAAARANMRRATRLALLAWALAPFAMVADILAGWTTR